jgi:hypothetical protein
MAALDGSHRCILVSLNQSGCSSSRGHSSSSHLPPILSWRKIFATAQEELADALSEPS